MMSPSNYTSLSFLQTTRHGSKNTNIEKNQNPRIIPCKCNILNAEAGPLLIATYVLLVQTVLSKMVHIQSWTFAYLRLLNKPYVNGVSLREQN